MTDIEQREGDRSEELLRLLATPHPKGPRDVYKSSDHQTWFVTNGQTLPDYQPFDERDVTRLIRRGLIEPTNPKLKGSYRLPHEVCHDKA